MKRNSKSENKAFSRYQLFALLSNIFTIVLLVVLFGVLDKLVNPFQRGFFCDDNSIGKPYYGTRTVSATWSIVIFLVLILVVVIVCDFVNQSRTPSDEEHGAATKKLRVTRWIYVMIVRGLTGLLGLCFALILVNISKLMVGRLRPNFLDVCKPTNCTGFVTFDACSTTNTKALRDARLSFPSGQSAGTAYSTVFFALYLEYAMQTKHVLLLKPLMQFAVLFGGVVICLTPISDYVHHWSDVLAGIVIGTLFAFYTIHKLMDLPNQTKHLQVSSASMSKEELKHIPEKTSDNEYDNTNMM